jgi:hypothetical protein
LKQSYLSPDDATAEKLTRVWDQLEKFVREDLGDGFQLRDIYSLIVAVMNGLEVYFQEESGYTLKKYALFLVDKIVEELVSGGIIPSEISMLVRLVPIGTVIDLVSGLTKKLPLVNRFGGAQASECAADKWVRRNWVAHSGRLTA